MFLESGALPVWLVVISSRMWLEKSNSNRNAFYLPVDGNGREIGLLTRSDGKLHKHTLSHTVLTQLFVYLVTYPVSRANFLLPRSSGAYLLTYISRILLIFSLHPLLIASDHKSMLVPATVQSRVRNTITGNQKEFQHHWMFWFRVLCPHLRSLKCLHSPTDVKINHFRSLRTVPSHLACACTYIATIWVTQVSYQCF